PASGRSPEGDGNFSDQPEFAQFTHHRRRQIIVARPPEEPVGRRRLGVEVAPALKRFPGDNLGRHDLPVELDEAGGTPLLIDPALEAENALARPDLAADHPEQRSAVEQLLAALRGVSGVDEAARLTRATPGAVLDKLI